ncbi:MAG: hypothetical protein AB8E82_16980 [Aureispira sp.]
MRQLETEDAIFIVHPNGIIEAHSKPDWDKPDTPEIARNYALKIKEAVGNNICGVLTIAPNLYIPKESLEAYASVDIGHIADALLVSSIGTRIFATVAIKIVKPLTPTKIFTKQKEAEEWLLEQIAAVKESRGNG